MALGLTLIPAFAVSPPGKLRSKRISWGALVVSLQCMRV